MGLSEERRFFYDDEIHPIDRDVLSLPEVVIEDLEYEDQAPKLLKPCFDAVWNACGFAGSLNF